MNFLKQPKNKKKESKKNNNYSFKTTKYGWYVLIFSLIMIVFGIIMVFDASVYIADRNPWNNKYFFISLHIMWVFISLIPAVVIYLFDYRKIIKLSPIALVILLTMLILVLFQGADNNGARRWLSLGHESLVIQPAEFAKPIIILYLAGWLSKGFKEYKSFNDALRFGFGKKLLQFSLIVGTILVLIVLEPDLGTTLAIGVTAFIMFFISGKDKAHIIGSMMTSLIGVAIAIFAAVLAPYRLTRIQSFLETFFTGVVSNPTAEGYQVHQILIGIGSGGFWGVGFGNSRQRFGYLAEITAFTDSIYAVIIEELGWVGGFIMVSSWLFFLYLALKISQEAVDRQGQILAIGIGVWLTLQAFIHMSVNVVLIPITGIPLPFVTYGGSGTIVAITAVALLLNISRITNEERTVEKQSRTR